MAISRKDSRGYVLYKGETQRKDGRYAYSYTDNAGKRHTTYARTLVALRQKKRQILRDLEDGLNPEEADKITLNQLFDKYIGQKYDLKPTTRAGYKYMYDRFVRDDFGKRKIVKIRYSDVREFYYDLIYQKKLTVSTVDGIHTLLHPALQMGVRDGLLRANPTDGVMGEIKKSRLWTRPKRHALTIPQQKAFMDYLRSSRENSGWVPILTVLLGTGMRIGECLGLTWNDLDFEKRTISVNHNLTTHVGEDGRCIRHISTPKTESSTRTIPMLDEVFEAFLKEYEIQRCIGYESETIDGYSGFVFTTDKGSVMADTVVNRAIHRIAEEYNAIEEKAAKKENREPLLLPSFSAHNLRHTFCTRLCENETNLKVIQSLMGHSDISTTMDVYAEATGEKVQEVVTSLNGKIIF